MVLTFVLSQCFIVKLLTNPILLRVPEGRKLVYSAPNRSRRISNGLLDEGRHYIARYVRMTSCIIFADISGNTLVFVGLIKGLKDEKK